MAAFNKDVTALALANADFRREVITTEHSQVVIMSVEPGDDIGEETHEVDQVLVFVAGTGDAVLNGRKSHVAPGHLVVVPAGTKHNFVNTGDEPLKLYTVYAPPEEEPGTVHRTKAEAEAAEAEEGDEDQADDAQGAAKGARKTARKSARKSAHKVASKKA